MTRPLFSPGSITPRLREDGSPRVAARDRVGGLRVRCACWFAAPAPAVEPTGPPRALALIAVLAATTALLLAPLVPLPVHLLGYAVGAWVTTIAAALFRRADAQERRRRSYTPSRVMHGLVRFALPVGLLSALWHVFWFATELAK
ncbi:MAG: hypothetical protein ACM3ZF_00270 [Mycobacterium leprae]